MMDLLAQLLNATPLPEVMKFTRWAYAAANVVHVLGFTLLVGAILPLDLRLLGAWKAVPHPALARILVPFAAAGLTLAILGGICLFAARTGHYARLDIFAIKLTLVSIGTAAALLLHFRTGLWMERATPRTLRLHGALSLACWLGALLAGRLIAYVAP